MVAWWTWWVGPYSWWDALDETLGPLALSMSSALFLSVLSGRYRRLLDGMLLASPIVLLPFVIVGHAATGYARGTAVYYSSGSPTVLDPHLELGIPPRSTGCIVTLQSELWQVVNNTTIELLVEHLGPMTTTAPARVATIAPEPR